MSRGLRVVDPYGPYGWIRSFTIRTRSENCISLRVLGIFSTLYRCQGGYGLWIRTVRTDGLSRFQSVHDRKNIISLRGLRIFSRLYRCEGGYGLPIRTVRTCGIVCFQSVHDWKIASH